MIVKVEIISLILGEFPGRGRSFTALKRRGGIGMKLHSYFV